MKTEKRKRKKSFTLHPKRKARKFPRCFHNGQSSIIHQRSPRCSVGDGFTVAPHPPAVVRRSTTVAARLSILHQPSPLAPKKLLTTFWKLLTTFPQPLSTSQKLLTTFQKLLSTFLKLLTTFSQRCHRYRPKQVVLICNDYVVTSNNVSIVTQNNLFPSLSFSTLAFFPRSVGFAARPLVACP